MSAVRTSAMVLVLVVFAAGVGYAAAPVGAPATPTGPEGLPLPGTSTEAALVSVTPEVPSEGPRGFLVEVLADAPVVAVELRADGEVVDSFTPEPGTTAVRTRLYHSLVAEVDAVVRLEDGREATSIPIRGEPPTPAFDAVFAAVGEATARADSEISFGDPTLPFARATLAEGRVRWDGPGRLVGGVLEVADPNVGRVFGYVSDDDVHWHRFPALGGTSLPVVRGLVDLREHLPVLDESTVRVELWRHDPDEVARLGFMEASVPDGLSAAEVMTDIGLTGRVELAYVERPATTSGDAVLVDHASLPFFDQPEEHVFRFTTDIPGATHVLWQAYSGGGPVGPPSPTDINVVRSGIATVQDGEFRFVVPWAEGNGAATESDDLTANASLAHWLLDGEDTTPTTNDTVTLDGPAPDALVSAGSLVAPSTGRNGWTLRALAFAGDQYLGIASNLVTLDIAPPQIFTIAPAGEYSLEAEVDAPSPVDPSYQRCYQVVGIDQAKRAQLSADDPIFRLQYAVLDAMIDSFGSSLCLGACYTVWVASEPWNDAITVFFGDNAVLATSPFVKLEVETGPGQCDDGNGLLIDTVTDLATSVYEVAGLGYDLAASTYNGAKDLVVTVVAKLSGCEAAVNVGSAIVGEDADAEELCRAAATIAVDAVLIYYGLPPSLPDREELIENAKGDLAALLVQLAKDEGVPCDELSTAAAVIDTKGLTCEEIAAKIVDGVSEELADALRANAANQGLPFPPGVSVIQDPRSTADPLQVRLEVVPEPGTSLGPMCEATVTGYVRWTPPMVTFPYGALFVEPRRIDLSDLPFNIPFREYIAMYGPETVLLPRPANPASTATLAVLLNAPPVGVGATAWRDIPSAFDGAPPRRDQFEAPVEVLTSRWNADVDVYVSSDCAGLASASTTIPFFSQAQ